MKWKYATVTNQKSPYNCIIVLFQRNGRFKAVPINIPAGIFLGVDRLILKLPGTAKRQNQSRKSHRTITERKDLHTGQQSPWDHSDPGSVGRQQADETEGSPETDKSVFRLIHDRATQSTTPAVINSRHTWWCYSGKHRQSHTGHQSEKQMGHNTSMWKASKFLGEKLGEVAKTSLTAKKAP